MRKYIIGFMYLLFTINSLFAQGVFKGIILNKKTNSGIDLVCINIKNSNKGIYSYIDGTFKLININDKDSIIFHHISFQDKIIAYNNFPKDGIIYLSPKVNEFPEVNVYKTSQKEYKLISRRKLLYNRSFRARKGTEVTILIENSKLEGACIKEFIFCTKKVKIYNYLMRIHLYENNDGVPGKEIIINSNKYYLTKGSTKQKINIYDNNILFPKNGLFCGLEWIGIQTNKSVIENINKSKELMPRILYRKKKDKEKAYISWYGRHNWKENTNITGFQEITYLLGLTLTK